MSDNDLGHLLPLPGSGAAPMLARQRQSLILDEVRRNGGVRVSDLTTLLSVSDMTIRRDLDQLVTDGVIRKVHGGAVLRTNVTEEPGFIAKSTMATAAKDAIADRAVRMVRPGSAIAISAGTTTTSFARKLGGIQALTVVTNSTTVTAAIENSKAMMQTVILTGGVSTPSAALVGPVAEATIRSLSFDQLFLGTHGIDADGGFTTPNLAEAETNRALISRSRQVIVVADSSKWGTTGLATFGALSVAHILIVDDGLPEDALPILRDAVADVIVVSSRLRSAE